MILLVDNYDSFTFNLYQYLSMLGEEVVVIRNDQMTLDDVDQLKPEMIVLSPGPGTPDESGICKDIVSVLRGKYPILGICLGHQTIAQSFGAEIVRAKEPVHGKVSKIIHQGAGIFKGIKSPLKVTRYHSLTVDPDSVPKSLVVTARTLDGVIMGIRHRELLIEGVQFHPEAILSELGHEMLNNFLKEAKEWWSSV